MLVEETAIDGVRVLTPRKYEDDRGLLSETYSRRALLDAGIETRFLQENHSVSTARGTVRGLHFQAPPHAQDKLVRVLRGAVLDVAVDLRRGSSTYGRWAAVELSASLWNQIFVPAGFAHGFCTLEPDTHVLYKLSAEYAPEFERGVRWDDPDLAIPWPGMDRYILSERDRAWPTLSELESSFDDREPVVRGEPS